MEFTRNNYITIQGFMVTDLKLSGNELVCYALIYGFTQDGETAFNGTQTYIASALNVSKVNVRAIIGRLVEKGLVTKKDYYVNNVKLCRYIANIPTGYETFLPHGNETFPYNNNYNYFIDNNKEKKINDKSLSKKENDKSKKTLFCNSEVGQLVHDNDYTQFEEKFGKEFAELDLVYYYHCVSDWSDKSDTKRTNRGWLATIRDFIRRDMEQGRTHKKPSMSETELFTQQAVEYLNL